MNKATYKQRTLFYRAGHDKSNIDDAIQFYGGLTNLGVPKKLRCAHTEQWFPDIDNNFKVNHLKMSSDDKLYAKSWFWGHCLTSTMRFGGKGVVYRPAGEVLKHPERWFYAEFEMEAFPNKTFLESKLERLKRKIEWELDNNKGYDKKCIASFFWPFGRVHSPDMWICSEIVAAVLTEMCWYNSLLEKVFAKWSHKNQRRNYRALVQGPVWSPTRLAGKLYEAGAVFREVKDDSVIEI